MTDRLPDVPMKAITVRMGQDVHAQIAAAAAEEGVSLSQYLRESALVRAWFTRGYRGGDDAEVARLLLAMVHAARDEGLDVADYVRRLAP